MIIHDEDASPWKVGRYRLRVACAGQGTVVAAFQLGDQGKSVVMPPCSEDGTSVDLVVSAVEAGVASAVTITPAGVSDAMIGYSITAE